MIKADKKYALELCKILYWVLEPNGYYPALTGGLLYKDSSRKDIDIVIYRNRQIHESFEIKDIYFLLEVIGITDIVHYGFVTKCVWKNMSVDLLNPESDGSLDYDGERLPVKLDQPLIFTNLLN